MSARNSVDAPTFRLGSREGTIPQAEAWGIRERQEDARDSEMVLGK